MRFFLNKWLVFFALVGMLLIFSWQYWRTKEMIWQVYYDATTPREEVKSQKDIDAILMKFKKVPFGKLEKQYVKRTLSDRPKYKPLLRNVTYYQIHRRDFFKYVAGDVRIKNLLAKDEFYKTALHESAPSYYWLINKKLLYKLLELQTTLKKKGYDPKAFHVRNGHRPPAYNERIGGASKSRHIKGEAIDIDIGDINKSGRYEKKDKQIVLDLLENQIIKSTGGIGRYPDSRSVHFDVRGHRARWDSF